MRQFRVLLIAGLLGLAVFSGCEESRVSSIVPQTSATLSDLDYDSIGNHSVWVIQDQLRKTNAPSDRVDAISRAALAEVRYAKPVEGPLQLRLNVDEIGSEGIDAALALRAAVRGAMRALSEAKADLSSEEQIRYTLAISNSGLIVSKSASEKAVSIPLALLAQASMTEIGRNLAESGISNVAITDVMKEVAGKSVGHLGDLRVSNDQLVDAVAAIAAGLSAGGANEGTANQISKSVASALAEKLSAVGLSAVQLKAAVKEIANRIVSGLTQTSLSAAVLTDTKAGLSEGIVAGLGTQVSQDEKDILAQTVQQVFTDTGAATIKVLAEEPSLRDVTLFGGISNRPLTISFSDVLSQLNFSIDDASRTRFLVSSIYSGEMRKGNIKMFQGALWVPGERIEWTPPLNAREGQRAFKLTALLGDTLTPRSINVTVYIQPANEAPKLSNFNSINGGNEDTPMVVSYDALKDSSDLFDQDSGQVYFKVVSLGNGKTLKGGEQIQLGSLIGPGEYVVWMPAENANGSLSPFSVVAFDGELESASPAAVNVSVAPVNDTPTAVAAAIAAGGSEDTAYIFTHAKLREVTQAADADMNQLSYKISGLIQGALKKPDGSLVRLGDMVNVGESVIWDPPANANGTAIPAFRVIAFDGIEQAAIETQIAVQVTPSNDAPVLTSIATLTSAIEARPYEITFEKLMSLSNLQDVDSANLKFRLVSVSGTDGEVVNKKGSDTPLTAGALIGSGDVLIWTPPAKYYPRVVEGFVVEGWDGELASVNKVGVNFEIGNVNQAPSFRPQARNSGAVPVIASADFILSYEKLANDLELTDPETGSGVPVQFRKTKPVLVIESVEYGQLKKNGNSVVIGTTTLGPGESWVWTAPNDRLGMVNALVVRARDADNTFSTNVATYVFEVLEKPNTPPTLTSVQTVQGAIEDKPISMRYEELRALSDAMDADNNQILFRVRELTSGKLQKGTVLVTPEMLADPGLLIGPGDQITWTPDTDDFVPSRIAFKISATDSISDSAVVGSVLDSSRYVPVSFNVRAENDAPKLLDIAQLTRDSAGAIPSEDIPVSISFSQLYFSASISDVDDTVAAAGSSPAIYNHRFVVRSILPDSKLLVDGNEVSAGFEITKSVNSISWVPPANAHGSLSAFVVKVKDENLLGSLESGVELPVNILVAADNDPPVLAISSGDPASKYRLTGAQEDIPFVLTYDAIRKALAVENKYISDVDGPQLEFMVGPVADAVTGNAVGVLSKSGLVTELNQLVRVQPGDALVWQPPLNKNGVIAAFTVRAFDGFLSSAGQVQMEVFVQPVNHPPVIATNKSLVAQKNSAFSISHLALTQVLELVDVENVQHPGDTATSCPAAPDVRLRIVDIPSGTLSKLNNLGTSVSLSPGQSLSPCEKIVWMPPTDAIGDFPAFRIRAVDDQGLMSSMTALIKFDVQGSNAAPFFSTNTPAILQDGRQDLPYTITHQALLNATGALDPENNPIRFEVSAGINGSTTYKGSNLITSTVLLGPGETIIWNPPPQVNGVRQAFEVRAYDSDKYSADDAETGRLGKVTIAVNLATFNRAPSIKNTPVLAGTETDIALEDAPYEISVEKLQAATQASDPDLNPVIRFKMNSAFSNSGTLQYEVTPGNWQNVSAGQGDILGTGYTSAWRWIPPTHTYGPIKAFAIQAFDGDNATGLSPVAVPVTINVQHVNHAPVLGVLNGSVRSIQTLNGGQEDLRYLIRYDALFGAGVPTDVDGDLLRFKFIASGVGTLFSNGNPVTTGALLSPGEIWTWQPPLNQSGTLTAFTMVVNDGTTDSPVALPVTVNVSAINDAPVFGESLPLNNATKNQANGYPISFNDIVAKIPVLDVETPPNQIEYRIESVGSGTLRMGTSQTGADVATLANNPMLRAAGGNNITAASQLNWTPPLNAVGTFTVMTLTAFDGTDYTVQPIEVKITVNGTNAVPTISSGLTLGSSASPQEGTYQNVPLVISYETLLQRSGAADTDLTTVYLRVTNLESGQLQVGSQIFSAAGILDPMPKIGPGEKVTWTPAAEARGVDAGALSAFRIQAFDNIDPSTNDSLVRVNVTPVNQAPLIAGLHTFPDAIRNQEYEITFNRLAEVLQISDVEDIDPTEVLATSPNKYGKMKLKIESLLGGQSLRIGANSGSASALSPTNNIVQPANRIFWKPPANARGTFDGFMVSVIDLDGRISPTMGKVRFIVDGPNIAPQIATLVKKYPDAGQNTPYIISYDTLSADLGVTDIDSANLSFVFTNINPNAGKLVVSASERSAWPNVTFAAPPTTAMLNKGEQMVFVPKDNFNGNNVEIFRVRVWDGEIASGQEAVVSLDISRVNQVPLMTRINTFTGAVQNTAFPFSYDDLRSKTDATDVEEPLPAKTLSFKVKSINSGSLRRVTSAVGVTPATYVNLSAGSVLNPNERFEWTPSLNANGTLNAMTLVAFDSDGAESQAPLVMYVVTASVNNRPVFTSEAFIPAATEDMPFVINYMMLNQYLPGFDVETGVLAYQVTSLGEGLAWRKGNTPFTASDLPLTVYPGESITWTPPANKNFTANGLMVPFSVRLLDAQNGLSEETKPVQVSVVAINDQPKISSVTSLGVVQKNHPNGFQISFDNLKSVIPLADDDGTNANQLKYRIEYVNSGTLCLGSTNSCVGNPNSETAVKAPNSMPFLVSVPANSNESAVLNWTPPLNATGSFVVMTVRAFDGQDFSASTAEVVVSVEGFNAKPVINSGFTLGANGTNGTRQNVPLMINYNTLLAQSAASDTDLTPVSFRITALESGTLKVGTTTYTAGSTPLVINPPALVGPGENIVWTPVQEAYGLLNAFRMRSFDNADQSDNEALVRVSTEPVNQVPTFNSEFTNPNGNRNVELPIDFTDLAQQLAVADVEDVNPNDANLTTRYAKMKFRVEQLMGGQSLRIGVDSGTAVPLALGSSNAVLTSGLKLFWMPPANVTGTYAAFRVSALDSANLPSSSTAIYRVTVAGDNMAPQVANTNVTFGLDNSVIENVPYTISFANLQTALGVTDADSPDTQLVFTSISNGVLRKMGNQMAAFAANPAAPVVPANAALFSRLESVVFYATDNLFGDSVEIFRVRAWDGNKYSSPEAVVSLKIGRVNYKPRLTYVNDFNGATEDVPFRFTYSELRSATDLNDIEESQFGANSLRFVVKNAPSGTLQRRSSVSPELFTDVVSGEFIASTDVMRWIPAPNTFGRQQAFSVTAIDGDNEESISVLPVYVNVASVNDAPVFGTTTFLAGAVEDQPYVISHGMLQQFFPGSDVENGTVNYQITSLGGQTGSSLKKGSQVITAAELPVVVYPGESLTWQPPLNANSAGGTLHKSFSIKLIDNNGAVSSGIAADLTSGTSVDVNVSIASINDIPVIAGVNGLINPNTNTANFNQNSAGGIAITYSMIKAAVPVADVETDPSAISYRIESINSGVLRMGNTNVGAVINPQINRPLLIDAVGDQTNTTGVVNWTPPLNAIGNYAVMTVRAVDTNNEQSSFTAEIRLNLVGSNAIPTIASTFTLGSNASSSGTSQNVALQIDYDTLIAQSQAADTDQTPLFLRITSLSSGTLTVGLNTFTTAGPLNPVPILGPGEKLVWKPAFNASGSAVDAFTIVATDNKDVSGTSLVKVAVTYVNQPPQMNAFAEYVNSNSATRNQYYTIVFSDMAEKLGVTDSDDVKASDPVAGRYNLMKFRIENIHSGQYLRVGTTFESATNVVAGQTLFESGQNLYWMPPANGAAIFDAFSVTAIDKDGLATANMGKVRVNVAGENVAPTAASSNTVMKSATENLPLTITYDEIRAKYSVTDVDSPWISLIVSQVNNGTLRKGGNVITPFTGSPGTPPATALIAPGETVMFFPNQNYNSSNAEIFRFIAYDGAAFSDADSATVGLQSVPVTVNIQPVNSAPTLNAAVVLDGPLEAARNSEYAISFDQLAEKLSLADVEDINPASPISGSCGSNCRYGQVKLRVDQILGGISLKNDAGLIDGTNNTIFRGQSLY